MRLTEAQVAIIKQTVFDFFGPEASVTLFGSRVDDAARGGDIDLLIELPTLPDNPTSSCAHFVARLQLSAIGDQRIDVVLKQRQGPTLPVHEIAKSTGILL